MADVENFILNVKHEHPSWGARKIRVVVAVGDDVSIGTANGFPVEADASARASAGCTKIKRRAVPSWGGD